MNDGRRRVDGTSALAREAARKGIHLTSVLIPTFLALDTPRRAVIVGLLVLLVIAIIVEVARRASPLVASRFERVFAPLLRSREHTQLTGATWLIGAMLAAVALLPRDAAIATTWAVAVGDASAAMIGMRFGHHRSTRSGKSLEGSAACLVATVIGAVLLARMPIIESLVIGVVATAAERAPWPADDNTRIVVLVGVTTWLWRIASY